jgi:hypothetical protein
LSLFTLLTPALTIVGVCVLSSAHRSTNLILPGKLSFDSLILHNSSLLMKNALEAAMNLGVTVVSGVPCGGGGGRKTRTGARVKSE